MIRPRSTLPVLLAVLIAAAGCSSGDDDSSAPSTTRSTTGTTAPARPAGPAADLATELTGGNGPYMGAFLPLDLGDAGYEQAEYAAAGTATSYKRDRRADGRRPLDVRAGRDRAVPHARARAPARGPDEVQRHGRRRVAQRERRGRRRSRLGGLRTRRCSGAGDAWVGVSAQRIGVEGGPVLVQVEDVPGAEDAGQGPQGDRSRAVRLARASRRRLLVRHLHAGRPGDPRRRPA